MYNNDYGHSITIMIDYAIEFLLQFLAKNLS